MARLKGLPPLVSSLAPAVGYADRQEARRAYDAARRRGENLRHLYSLKRWRDLRLVILERDGWTCQGCEAPHLLTGKAPAPNSPVIDHKTPHRGNLLLFWDEANLQAVCKAWHDTEKQRQERAAEAAAGAGRGGCDP